MRSFWDKLEIWLRSWTLKPDTAVPSPELPVPAAEDGSPEATKGGPMETTFENLVEFFEAEGLKHEARPEDGIVIAGFGAQNLTVRIYFTLQADEGCFSFLHLCRPRSRRDAVLDCRGHRQGKLWYEAGQVRTEVFRRRAPFSNRQRVYR